MGACGDVWGDMTCTRPLGHGGMHVDETVFGDASDKGVAERRVAELEAQLAAARSALAACREVAGKRAGDDA